MNNATPHPTTTVYMARQAIFDRDQRVFAYELLYRNARMNGANFSDPVFATTRVITNTFLEIGIESISDGKPVFINLPRAFITGEYPLPFSPMNIVLEILEDIQSDEETVAGLKRLSDEGFLIALDDFVLDEKNIDFIAYADFIKIDITQFTPEQLVAEVSKLRHFKVQLLAEKVETESEFNLCHSLGFTYFQGYFLCKPVIHEGQELPANQLALLQGIAKLQSPDAKFQDIEDIISNDVAISYKLLKIINSSLYNLGKNVESIQHALVLLGLDALKKWMILLSIASVENKPAALINQTLIRAKMCEEVARSLNIKTASAFTVGMFSLLDALMNKTLEQLMSRLPLSSDITDALIKQDGTLGKLLCAVKSYESGDWHNIDETYLENGAMNLAYAEALRWQRQISEEIFSK